MFCLISKPKATVNIATHTIYSSCWQEIGGGNSWVCYCSWREISDTLCGVFTPRNWQKQQWGLNNNETINKHNSQRLCPTFRKVPGSNLSRNTGYPDWRFSSFSSVILVDRWESTLEPSLHILSILLLLQLIRIRPYGLFQFRNTSEIMNPFRHLVALFAWVTGPMKHL